MRCVTRSHKNVLQIIHLDIHPTCFSGHMHYLLLTSLLLAIGIYLCSYVYVSTQQPLHFYWHITYKMLIINCCKMHGYSTQFTHMDLPRNLHTWICHAIHTTQFTRVETYVYLWHCYLMCVLPVAIIHWMYQIS